MHTITVDGKAVTIESGKTLKDAIDLAQPHHRALGARIGGEEYNLRYAPKRDLAITTLTFDMSPGRRVYERSLCFLFLMAARRLFPGKRMVFEHSLDQCVVVTPHLDRPLTTADVAALEAEMHELVRQDLPLVRTRWPIDKAISHFAEQGQEDKVRLLQYRDFNFFDVYECDGMAEYLYGEMVPSTGYIRVFGLRFRLPGLLIKMPDLQNPTEPADVHELPRFSRALDLSKRWGQMQRCEVAADLNDMITSGRIREYIRVCEALHEKQISDMAQMIVEREVRAVMVAGPSSSGKTTFTNRLCVHLRVHGKQPLLLSLDNYYLDKEDIPLGENGERDLESIETLDIPRFNQDLELLLSGAEVEVPIFDFKSGRRAPHGLKLQLPTGSPVLIEGIHGLNERMSENIPAEMKYKVYITALARLNLDDHNRIRSTDGRILRRLVRDYHHRNATMEETLRMWPSVRRGEHRWIFPYQEEADVIFNSSLGYELVVIKKHIYPLLREVQPDSEFYADSRRLVKFLKYFIDADVEDEVPPTSLLREFIGGNTFYIE